MTGVSPAKIATTFKLRSLLQKRSSDPEENTYLRGRSFGEGVIAFFLSLSLLSRSQMSTDGAAFGPVNDDMLSF